ncbi:hypothetical protein MBLNU457_5767t1 [Dothideomycetes sp. NU457]
MFSGTLSRTTSGSASKVASSAVQNTFHHGHGQRESLRGYSSRGVQTLQYGRGTNVRPAKQNIEDIFFQALSRASLCKEHGRAYTSQSSICSSGRSHRPDLQKPRSRSPQHTAPFSTKSSRNKPAQATATATNDESREELKSLVDVYQSFQDEIEEPEIQAPPPQSSRRYSPGARDSKPEQANIWETWTPREPDDEEVAATVSRLNHLINDQTSSPERLFRAYQALPSPRMEYLNSWSIRMLIRGVRAVEFKNQKNMLRYFTLMDDLVAAGLPLQREDWNVSITYAGRWNRTVRDEQVESAMRMWIRMEREGGKRADKVTFNTLFDIATKADKFALGEVILSEIEARNMTQTLFLRTNKIIYYGKKMDAAGVRRSYKELVDAGDFVNTYVLNCVISGLIRAGEASAAEQVFVRMKQMAAEKTGRRPNPADWKEARRLGNLLTRAAKEYRDQPEQRAAIQDTSPVAPSLETYHMLVRYHANDSGNIDRVSELMQDMRAHNLPLHGSIFYQVFRGFSIHGGVRYSSWTKSRLDRLWKLFLIQVEQYKAVNENLTDGVSEVERGCYIEYSVVYQALFAYFKCAKSAEVLEVWHSILDRWTPSEDERASLNGLLARHLDIKNPDDPDVGQ